MNKTIFKNKNPYSLQVDKNESATIVFRLPVNLGDSVIFTVLLEQIKSSYPKLCIVVDCHKTFNPVNFEKSRFSDVLINNPHIDVLLERPEDFYKLQDKPKTISHYHMDLLMIQLCFLGAWQYNVHEADIFCDILGLPRPKEIYPKVYLTKSEKDKGQKLLNSITNNSNKKKIILHIEAINPLKRWPFENWLKLINTFQNRFEFIQVGINKEYVIPGIYNMVDSDLTLRDIASLAYNADYFMGVDSGIHHLCYAVGLKGLIIAPSIYPKTLWAYQDDIVFIKTPEEIPCAYCGQNRLGMAVWELNSIPEKMNNGYHCCTIPKCINSITYSEVEKYINKNL